MESKTIVLIHGLFQNPKSWDHWKSYFEENGYKCFAPAYPFHEGNPVDLRSTPDPGLNALTLNDVVAHYKSFIDGLKENPILIGHSMGGLVVQRLVNMEIGAAGICIDSAPPAGIFTFQWSFLKANFSTINPLRGNSICMPTVRWFQYAFCNTMTIEETNKIYDRYFVPESRNIPRSSTGKDGKIDFTKPHKPLLFIAGEDDHIIPASLNRKNAKAYKDHNSLVDLKEFPGRTHYICGQENWRDVANHVKSWIEDKVLNT
jgi:pimeloyl-ACP methyl ester carboxylesterase